VYITIFLADILDIACYSSFFWSTVFQRW